MTLPIETPKMSWRFEAFERYESLLFEYLRLSVLGQTGVGRSKLEILLAV